MRHYHLSKFVISSCVALTLVLMPSAHAQNAVSTPLNTVKNLLIGMGFDPQPVGNALVTKEGKFSINYFVSSDQSTIYVFEGYTVTPEQASKAPLLKMLIFNDSHPEYFSLAVDGNNIITNVTLDQSTSLKELSAAALKPLIDNIKQTDVEQQALFNPNNWK